MVLNETKVYQRFLNDTKVYQRVLNDTLLYQRVLNDTKVYQRVSHGVQQGLAISCKVRKLSGRDLIRFYLF